MCASHGAKMLQRVKNSRHEVSNNSLCVLSGRLDSLGGRFSDHLVAIAFWPARVARRKGHSFILYFIFSLIFFPLALLTAYLVRDRRGRAY
jgi:hypothetical protein